MHIYVRLKAYQSVSGRGEGGLNIRERILETNDSNTGNVESSQHNKPLSLRLHPTAQINVQSSAIPGSLGSFYIIYGRLVMIVSSIALNRSIRIILLCISTPVLHVETFNNTCSHPSYSSSKTRKVAFNYYKCNFRLHTQLLAKSSWPL